ncbi:PF11337 family protein [Staphylococcus aureus subsp. aureus IS-105]|nr:PF11337 family protein [Staphylococcus aureus subsp. aureus IS-105]
MKKKKNVIKVIIILFISLIVAVAFFFGLKTYQGHKNIQLIDSYLEEKSLKDKIKSEKTEYSAKKRSLL